MRRERSSVFVATILATSVAACGGGGDPSWVSDATQFESWSAVAADGAVQAGGEARTATLVMVGPDAVDLINASGPQDATTTALIQADALVALQASTDGLTVTLDTRQGAINLSDAFVIDLTSRNGEEFIILANPDGAGFEYQSFGTWAAQVSDTRAIFAVGSFGAPTPVEGIPDGSGYYFGVSEGYASDSMGNLYVTTSTITLSTEDFVIVKMTSDGTWKIDPFFGSSEEPDLNFSGDLTLIDGKLLGDVTGTLDAPVSGTATTTLYGPSAEEAGGTFATEGGGWTNLGSFGAVAAPIAP